jgi:hypothetical protein
VLKKGGACLVLDFLRVFEELDFFSFLSPTKELRMPFSMLCRRLLIQLLLPPFALPENIVFGRTFPKAILSSFSIVLLYFEHSPLSSSMYSFPSEMIPRCSLIYCRIESFSSSMICTCSSLSSVSFRVACRSHLMILTSALTGAISRLYSSSIRQRSSLTLLRTVYLSLSSSQ